MAWTAKEKLVNTACVVTLGDPVVHERRADGVQTSINCILLRGAEYERNNPGYIAEVFIPEGTLPVTPIKGDFLIFDGRRHEAMTFDPDSAGAVTLKLRYLEDVI